MSIADDYGHGWLAGIAAVRFIPKRACEGAATIDHGDMRECPHSQCGISIAHDLVDHPFFGFASACPLKRVETHPGKVQKAKEP